MANVYCSNCGAQVSGAAFCATCGTAVAAPGQAPAGSAPVGSQPYVAPTYGGPAYSAAPGNTGKTLQTGRLTYVEAIKSFFANYVNFQGRATLSAYWFSYLFTAPASVLAFILDIAITGGDSLRSIGIFSTLVSFGLFLPSISVAVRRLHDTGKSGHYYWFILIPFVGPILLIVFLASAGQPNDNVYGPRA